MSSTTQAIIDTVSRSQKLLSSSPSFLVQSLAQSCHVPVESIADAYPPSPLQSSMFAAFLNSSLQNPLYVARLVFTLSTNELKDSIRNQDLEVVERFRHAWSITVQRNAMLRTRLVRAPNGKEYLVVLRDDPSTCRYVDGISLEEFLEANHDRLDVDYGRALNKCSVLDRGTCFVWTISHVLYDGWSLPLILSDFSKAWKLSSQGPSPGGQGLGTRPRPGFKAFVRYLARQRKEMRTEALEFWRRELSTADEFVQFPQSNGNSDSGYTPMTSAFHIESATVSWPSPSHFGGTKLSTNAPPKPTILPSTYLWAAWALVLWKHTDRSSVLFGATLNGRRYPVPGIDEITGPTFTTVPVMVRIDPEVTVGEFLQCLQRKASGSAEYGWMGLQEVSSVCGGGLGKMNSIMVVNANSSSGGGGESQSFGAILRPTGWTFDESRSSAIQHNVGICLICDPSDSGLNIVVQYDPHLKTDTEIGWIAGQFTAALKQLLRADAQTMRLGQARISGDREIQQIQEWNSKYIESVDECLHDLFEAQARATGDAEAICCADKSLSYKQLDGLSQDLAKFLYRKDLGSKSMVPIAFENSWLAVVAILAVWRVGACFVPIHPSTPRERLASILRQVDAKTLICSETLVAGIQEYGFVGMELWTLSDTSLSTVSLSLSSEAAAPHSTMELPRVSPSALAYTLFTSGTTGVPKGVCMSHRASSTGNTAYAERLSLTTSSRVLQFSSLSFDVSCLEIFATLLSGGCICIPPPQDRLQHLHSAIRKLRCNVLVLTPTVAKLLQVDFAKEEMPGVEVLCMTGEPMTAGDVEFWAPRTRLINGYGPTETCFCTFSRALNKKSSAGNIGFGSACNSWIVDEAGTRLAPLGTKGELFIEGPIVADGYLNDADRTRQLFAVNPPWLPDGWKHDGGTVVAYRTGDLARYNHDGSVECFGRRDCQIKLRGMRIDLGEVENAISSLEHKAVVLFPDVGLVAGNITAVVAFEPSDDTSGSLEILPEQALKSAVLPQLRALRRHASLLLPSYMLPTFWIPVNSLPMLVASAKVSRLAVKKFVTQELQEDWLMNWRNMLTAMDRDSQIIQPKETVAIELAQIVDELTRQAQEIFDEGRIYHDLVLSQAGIDSVQVTQLAQVLSERYGICPTVGKILGSDMSIRDLAQYVMDLQANLDGQDQVIQQGVDLIEEYRVLSAILEDHLTPRESHRPSNFKPPGPISIVFTTGASGYLGIEILHQLFEREEISKIITLVRASSMDKALAKIESAAKYTGWSLTSNHLSKLDIWLGDLSKPNLGLSTAHWECLQGNCPPHEIIDAVIHAGATVNWAKSYEQLKAVNILSTLTLLNACTCSLQRTRQRPRFVQVSGGRKPAFSFASSFSWEIEGRQLARTLSAPGTLGYTQTKLVSDLLVCKWASLHQGDGASRHWDASVVRIVMPGYIIGGAPNAVPNTDDVLWRLVRTNIEMGMYSSEVTNNVNSWVYLASSAVVARKVWSCLSSSAPSADIEDREAMHMAIPVLNGMSEMALWSLISRSGYPLAPVPHDAWLAAVNVAVEGQVKHPLYPVWHLVRQGVGLAGDLPSVERDRFDGNAEMKAELERDLIANLRYLRRMDLLPCVVD